MNVYLNGEYLPIDLLGQGDRSISGDHYVAFAAGVHHLGIERTGVGCNHRVQRNIRRLRKPDPYKQKGVRYTGEVLKKKAGKTGAK